MKLNQEHLNSIQLWFAGGKEYSAGLQLLTQAGHLPHLVRTLARTKNAGKLEYELSKLVKGLPPLPKQKHTLVTVVSKVSTAAATGKKSITVTPSEADGDEVLAGLHKKQKDLMDERRGLHSHSLGENTPQEERHKAALRIEQIGDDLDFVGQSIAHYKKHKTLPLPEAKTDKYQGVEDIVKQLANITRYRNRYKNNHQKLAQLDAEEKDLKQKLNAIQPAK